MRLQQDLQLGLRRMLAVGVTTIFNPSVSLKDFAALKAHGFSEEDAWDIAAVAAFFALSNRMANFTAMRPNDEFYAMGRG